MTRLPTAATPLPQHTRWHAVRLMHAPTRTGAANPKQHACALVAAHGSRCSCDVAVAQNRPQRQYSAAALARTSNPSGSCKRGDIGTCTGDIGTDAALGPSCARRQLLLCSNVLPAALLLIGSDDPTTIVNSVLSAYGLPTLKASGSFKVYDELVSCGLGG